MSEFSQELMVHSPRPPAAFAWPHARMAYYWALRTQSLKINQLSQMPLLSRSISPGMLPSRSLEGPKPAFLKSRVAFLLLSLLPPLRILNRLWFTEAKAALTFTSQNSSPLFVRISRASLSLAPPAVLLVPAQKSSTLREVTASWTPNSDKQETSLDGSSHWKMGDLCPPETRVSHNYHSPGPNAAAGLRLIWLWCCTGESCQGTEPGL